MKSHQKLKKIIFQKKNYSKFSYCYTGLGAGCSTKQAITASFVEEIKKIKKIQCASSWQW